MQTVPALWPSAGPPSVPWSCVNAGSNHPNGWNAWTNRFRDNRNALMENPFVNPARPVGFVWGAHHRCPDRLLACDQYAVLPDNNVDPSPVRLTGVYAGLVTPIPHSGDATREAGPILGNGAAGAAEAANHAVARSHALPGVPRSPVAEALGYRCIALRQ